MNAKDAIKAAIESCDHIWQGYVQDLTDAELLVRPVPGCNHIAWQMGHAIAGEHFMMEGVAPGKMPPLPAGFAEKHDKATAGSDDPKAFLKKDEYLKLAAEQRRGTLAILAGLSEADLDKPGPEKMRAYAARVGDLMILQGTHWLMHAGQWAVIRRKLGKPPLY